MQVAATRIVVLGTGGTIAGRAATAQDNLGYQAAQLGVDALLQGVQGVAGVALHAEQVAQIDSKDMDFGTWCALAQRCAHWLAQTDVAGIVVTHGTDTMEETAFFLDLTVGSDHPVIVTGAMRPADAIGADGPANLFNAVRAAAAPASRGRGTMVLMDDRLFAAREVTKTNTTRVETFQAPEHGPLAITDHDTIFFNRARPSARHTFDVGDLKDLPRVEIIYSYGGADSTLIDAAVAAGAKGIVVAGVGAGGTSPAQGAALRRASQKGVIVVMSSRTGSGRVSGSGATRISAGDLNVQKARILLMLALTKSSDPKEVARIFAEHTGSEQ